MGIGDQMQRFGESLRGAITAGAEGEYKAAKIGAEMREKNKPEINPVKIGEKIMFEGLRAKDPKVRAAKMEEFDDFTKHYKVFGDWKKSFTEKMVKTYGDAEGNIPGHLGTVAKKLPIGLDPVKKFLGEYPKSPGLVESVGAQVSDFIGYDSGLRSQVDVEKKREALREEMNLELRNYVTTVMPEIDSPGIDMYIKRTNFAIDNHLSRKKDDPFLTLENDDSFPLDVTTSFTTGVKNIGGKQRTGIVSRDADKKKKTEQPKLTGEFKKAYESAVKDRNSKDPERRKKAEKTIKTLKDLGKI